MIARGMEGALIVAVLATIVSISTCIRNGGRRTECDQSSNFNPILKLVELSDGAKLMAQCGSSEIYSVDLDRRSAQRMKEGIAICDWGVSRDGRTFFASDYQKNLSVSVDGETVVEEHYDEGQPLLCGMSPDGSLVVAIDSGTHARCWNLNTGETIEFRLRIRAHKIAIDHLGQRLYVNSRDNVLERYSIAIDPKPEILTSKLSISSLSISDDCRWLIIREWDRLLIHKTDSFMEQSRIEIDNHYLVSYSLSEDSRQLALVYTDGLILVKEIASGKTILEDQVTGSTPLALSFLHSDQFLVAGNRYGEVTSWPLRSVHSSYEPIVIHSDYVP